MDTTKKSPERVMVPSEEDGEQFSLFLTTAMTTYFRHDIGTAGVVLWFEQFVNVASMAQFKKAFNAYMNETRVGFQALVPTPADITARIHGSLTEQAWRKVAYLLKHYGSSYNISLGDSRSHHAISAMGGWPAFCRLFDHGQNNDARRQFDQHYTSANENELLSPLIGSYGDGGQFVQLTLEANGQLKLSRPQLPALVNKANSGINKTAVAKAGA